MLEWRAQSRFRVVETEQYCVLIRGVSSFHARHTLLARRLFSLFPSLLRTSEYEMGSVGASREALIDGLARPRSAVPLASAAGHTHVEIPRPGWLKQRVAANGYPCVPGGQPRIHHAAVAATLNARSDQRLRPNAPSMPRQARE